MLMALLIHVLRPVNGLLFWIANRTASFKNLRAVLCYSSFYHQVLFSLAAIFLFVPLIHRIVDIQCCSSVPVAFEFCSSQEFTGNFDSATMSWNILLRVRMY